MYVWYHKNISQSRDVHETLSAEAETLGTMSETRLRPRRYKLPRRLVKSSKQSPHVAAYRDNWSGIRANHVAFIIRAFYGLVNAVVGLPYVILVSVVY